MEPEIVLASTAEANVESSMKSVPVALEIRPSTPPLEPRVVPTRVEETSVCIIIL